MRCLSLVFHLLSFMCDLVFFTRTRQHIYEENQLPCIYIIVMLLYLHDCIEYDLIIYLQAATCVVRGTYAIQW